MTLGNNLGNYEESKVLDRVPKVGSLILIILDFKEGLDTSTEMGYVLYSVGGLE